MTNIGAIPVTVQKIDGKKEKQIFLVADSMGSNDYIKNDTYQKLFQIGQFLLMGTGMMDPIERTALIASKIEYGSAKQLASDVLRITDEMLLPQEDGLSFIVAGKCEDGLSIFDINARGNSIAEKNERGPKRGFKEVPYAFNGSGSPHVRKYREIMASAGHPIPLSIAADGLGLLYEFAKQGAIDIGVNDKLQFGIITPQGVSTLYHPDVEFLPTFRDKYLENLLGRNQNANQMELFYDETREALKWKDAYDTISSKFYSSLEQDLRVLKEFDRISNVYSNRFKRNEINMDALLLLKQRYLQSLRDVEKGAQALITKGTRAIKEYVSDFDERQMASIRPISLGQ